MKTVASLYLLWTLVAAACGDIRVRSIPAEVDALQALRGEWSGRWRSDANGAEGEIGFRIQSFEGQTLVAITTDNPCLSPREFELEVVGRRVLLREQAATVLQADIVSTTELVGTYGCADDVGTWRASRIADVAEPIDLGGAWAGTLVGDDGSVHALEVMLTQRVQAGQLRLDAQVGLPALAPLLPASGTFDMTGFVQFAGDGFAVELVSVSGGLPVMVLSGAGTRQPVALPMANLRVFGPSPLTFSSGVVSLEPR